MSSNSPSRTAISRGPLVLALMAVIALFVSSACDPVTPAAIRVDGWEMSRSRFLEELDQLAGDEELMQILGLSAYSDTDKGSYDTAYTSAIANLHVINRLLEDEVQSRGLEVDRDAARQMLLSQLTSMINSRAGTQGAASGAASANEMLDRVSWIGDALVTRFAYSAALQEAFSAEMNSEEELRALYEKYKDQIGEQACASHILVSVGSVDQATGQPIPGTEAEDAEALAKANSLDAQLAAGADFAKLAETESDDPGSAAAGGSLGCNAKGVFVPEFDDAVWSANVGEVVGPIKTAYGYHLIKVERRGTPTFEDLRPQLEQNLSQQAGQAVADWLTTKGKTAQIEVDPRFGSWDPERGAVVSPDGSESPPSRSLTTTVTGLSGDPSAPDGGSADVPTP